MRPSASCALRICRSCRLGIRHGTVHPRPLHHVKTYSWRPNQKAPEEVSAKERGDSLLRALGLAPENNSKQSETASSSSWRDPAKQTTPSRQSPNRRDGSNYTSDDHFQPQKGRGAPAKRRNSPDHVASPDEVEALIRGSKPSSSGRKPSSSGRHDPSRHTSINGSQQATGGSTSTKRHDAPDHIASPDETETMTPDFERPSTGRYHTAKHTSHEQSRQSTGEITSARRRNAPDYIATPEEVEAIIRGFGGPSSAQSARPIEEEAPASRSSTSGHVASPEMPDALSRNSGPRETQSRIHGTTEGNNAIAGPYRHVQGQNSARPQSMNMEQAEALILQMRRSLGLRSESESFSQPGNDKVADVDETVSSETALRQQETEAAVEKETGVQDQDAAGAPDGADPFGDEARATKAGGSELQDNGTPEDGANSLEGSISFKEDDVHLQGASEAHPILEELHSPDPVSLPGETEEAGLFSIGAVEQESVEEAKKPASKNKNEAKAKRKYGDELLYQKEVGVKALGKDFEALILRNPNKMSSSVVDVPIIERDQPSIPFDLKSVVTTSRDDGADDSQANLFQNIEELRNGDDTVLRSSQFEDLQNALVEGFTTAQMREYYHSQPRAKPESLGDHSWIIRHFDVVQSVQPKAMLNTKAGLAQRIMRDIWRLETLEEHERLIEAAFEIQNDAWWLLDNSASELAQTIRQDLLDPSNQETMVLRREAEGEALLILRTRKATFPAVLSRIDAAVTSITSRKIDLSKVAQTTLKNWLGLDHVRLALGRPTQTFIGLDVPPRLRKTRSPASKQLSISWLPTEDRPAAEHGVDNSVGKQLEDPADVVTRLVLRKPEAVLFSTEVEGQPPSTSPYERSVKGMSAFDQSGWRWSRVASIGRATPEAPVPDNPAVDIPQPKSLVRGSSSELGLDTSETLTATFGHILWRSEAKIREQIKDRRGNFKSQRDARRDHPRGHLSLPKSTLLPTVPHPAALTSITTPSTAGGEGVTRKTTIVLHFEPHPLLWSPDSSSSPDVRLQMPVESDADLSNFQIPATTTLNAVSKTTQGYMFSASPVDARIESELLSPLDKQDVAEFLHASEFNLANGRIRTPSKVELVVPCVKKTTWGSDAETLRVPYLFTGLEVHQSVEMPWKDVTLRYTSIEAGLHGGQRQELSLVRTVPQALSKTKRKATLASLMKLVKEVAEGQHFSWTRGAADMKPAPRPAWDPLEDWPSTRSSETHHEIVENPFAATPADTLEGQSTTGPSLTVDTDSEALQTESNLTEEIDVSSAIADALDTTAPVQEEDPVEMSHTREDDVDTPISEVDGTTNEQRNSTA
ncbi:mitochondrial inner-membrane-bound regulator domain-containing protein [Sarocladium implicatum]|nr:mitochondrial inner-membrane-bound regulator domain-containing protein [Sarocladium implicatum]